MKTLYLALLLFAVPSFASAASHTYVCGGLNNNDSATCTSGSWTKTAPFSLYDADQNAGAPFFPISTGTYYMSYVISGGSGNTHNLTCTAGASCTPVARAAGTYVDDPLVVNSGTNGGFYLNGLAGSANATVSNICITDTIGGCSAAVPAPVYDDFWFFLFGW